jgi:hypothetical protein
MPGAFFVTAAAVMAKCHGGKHSTRKDGLGAAWCALLLLLLLLLSSLTTELGRSFPPTHHIVLPDSRSLNDYKLPHFHHTTTTTATTYL